MRVGIAKYMQPMEGNQMSRYKVGYFVGSLSSTSINRELAKALIRLAPKDLDDVRNQVREKEERRAGLRVVLDLLTVKFLTSFSHRPQHVLGAVLRVFGNSADICTNTAGWNRMFGF